MEKAASHPSIQDVKLLSSLVETVLPAVFCCWQIRQHKQIDRATNLRRERMIGAYQECILRIELCMRFFTAAEEIVRCAAKKIAERSNRFRCQLPVFCLVSGDRRFCCSNMFPEMSLRPSMGKPEFSDPVHMLTPVPSIYSILCYAFI